jgi:chromate transporter
MGNEPASRSSPPPPRSCGRRGSGRITIIAVAALLGWRLFRAPLAVGAHARGSRGPSRGRLHDSRCSRPCSWRCPSVASSRARRPSPSSTASSARGRSFFGGGHVVLPFSSPKSFPRAGSPTRSSSRVWCGPAVPGPLFTFAAYLGAVRGPHPQRSRGSHHRPRGHLPAVLPLDRGERSLLGYPCARAGFQGALRGINAAVVGLLLAALYQPVWTSAIRGPRDLRWPWPPSASSPSPGRPRGSWSC